MSRPIHDSEPQEVQQDTLSLSHVVRVARRYSRTIWITMATVGAVYVVAALAVLLVLPAERMTSLDFRLEFRGAERGEYPNGTRFSSTEIISSPVLVSVYKADGLNRYVKFDRFKSAVYVMQSNEGLESLIREYRSKLSDSKLTAVERDQIEKEFAQKRAALSQAEYTISLVTSNRLRGIPSALRAKVLYDILSSWASLTVKDKGVSLYDISIVSGGIFEQDRLSSYDYIIALDLVRSKITRVVANIDNLLNLPGSKVLRTKRTGRSLAELRVRLSDTLDFRLRPLLGMILSNGISKTPTSSMEFVKTQLKFNQLETQEAAARVDAVRDALATYVQERQRQEGESTKGASSSTSTVIPQIDESFLNRIVEMTGEASDLEYRQKLVDRLQDESMRVVPLQAEARYYQTMLDTFRGSLRPATTGERQMIEAQLSAIVADAVTETGEVNEIYEALSRDLNPSTILYSVTDPPSNETSRPVQPMSIVIAGLLLLICTLPVTITAIVLYDNSRDDDEFEVQRTDAQGTPSIAIGTADTIA